MGIAAQCVAGAGLCFIPKPENDHRPWVLRHTPLGFVSALLIVTKVLAVGIVALTPAPADLSTITTGRIIQLTNAERKKAGLSELAVNSLLSSAAAQKGQHMLAEDYFAHISPSGVTPWFWMSKVGYSYQVAGENLAIDFVEAEDVVAAWMASPTHKDNMLHADYIETGVGVVTGEFQGGTSTVVVHMFGLPAGGASQPTATLTPTPAVKAQTTPSQLKTQLPIATPTPSPTPSPTPAGTTAPRVPRIAVLDAAPVQQEASFTFEGDPETRIVLLINDTEVGTAQLPADGKLARHTVSVAGLADGTLTARAYAVDSANNRSEISQPVQLTKDTVGPQLAREEVSFLLSPATDSPYALLQIRQALYDHLDIAQKGTTKNFTVQEAVLVDVTAGPFTVSLLDSAGNATVIENVTLQPAYATEADQRYLGPPQRFSQLTRRLTLLIATTISILMVLAILVRIRIQKPALLVHASFVLLLAGVFFFL